MEFDWTLRNGSVSSTRANTLDMLRLPHDTQNETYPSTQRGGIRRAYSRATPGALCRYSRNRFVHGSVAHLYRCATAPARGARRKAAHSFHGEQLCETRHYPRAEGQALHREPCCHAYRNLPDETHILDGRHPFVAASFGSDPRHRPRIQLLLRGGRGKPSPALLRRNCPHEPWIVRHPQTRRSRVRPSGEQCRRPFP